MRRLLALACAVLVAACGQAGTKTPAVASPSLTQPPVPAHCTARGLLPDPVCTPGATNPAVTQATIHQTVCVTGWTSTIRPPVTWSEPLKRRLAVSYGYRGRPLPGLELDHLIPLVLGGAPAAVANLWPEVGASPNKKDQVELAARTAVCRKTNPLQLVTAQQAIAQDWVAFGRSLGVKIPIVPSSVIG